MTTNFDNFVNLFLEATSFMDLPDKPPYGFWISPHGEFFSVKFEQHYEVALKIITRNRTLDQEYDKAGMPDPYEFLTARKYIRMVKSEQMYYADLYTYTDRMNHKFIPFEPTNTSVRLIKDIGEFYGMKITFNKS